MKLSSPAARLCHRRHRRQSVPEDDDEEAEKAFREIARVTKGAYCKFSPGSAKELGELLRAVAAYAVGGLKALAQLEAQGKPGAIKLLGQLR